MEPSPGYKRWPLFVVRDLGMTRIGTKSFKSFNKPRLDTPPTSIPVFLPFGLTSVRSDQFSGLPLK